MSRISLDDVWVAYRIKSGRGWRRREGTWALREIGFSVQPGELLGVIGGNGSGKSTLLQCIAGVIRPTKGRVSTDGRVASLIELSAGFNRELTGRENALIVGVLSGMSRSEVRERYERIQAFSELESDTMAMPVRTFSQGMILRLGFALAVESDPRVIVIDEGLAVADDEYQQKCRQRLEELRRAGASVVLVSHELDTIKRDCDRVLVLRSGRMIFDGAPDDAVTVYLTNEHAQTDV